MALRQIDNTPTPIPSTDRPKKQPKLSLTTRSRLPTPMKNDENQAPTPPQPNPDASFEYFASEDLKPLSDPQSKIITLVEGLESKNWTVICDSINDARRLSIFHSDLLLPVLEKVIVVLVKAMKNPRSTLCKTSIMASADIFIRYGDKMFLHDSATSDQLLLQLLLKSSQDKRFVCEEADKALTAMVGSAPPRTLLHKLMVYVSHTNLRIRAKAAIYMSSCVSKMSAVELKEFGMVSLLKMSAERLNDRLPEAREAARSTVMSLYKAFSESLEEVKEEEEDEEGAWQKLCQDNLPALHAQSVMKITLPQ